MNKQAYSIKIQLVIPALLIFFIFSCSDNKTLPYYGKYPIKIGDSYDTITKTIPPFEFLNQDSILVSEKITENKIYVADFFFTSCPSICPVMKRQMLRINEKYLSNPNILLLSFTIDPKRDTPSRLKSYAKKLNIETFEKWQFLTGNKEEIYYLAEEFMVDAYEDKEVPGGFEHSGKFILVDKEQMVRGYYDGTDEKQIDTLLMDMDILLTE